MNIPLLLSTSLGLLATAPAAVVISEFQPNPTGGDPSTQTIELSGNPNEAFSGFISTLETNTTLGAIGAIDRQTMISGNLNANGFATVSVPDLENPSFTILFHSANGGGIGTDLDTDDNRSLDSIVSLGTIFDALSIPDRAADVGLYGVQLGGQDFSFTGAEPELVFRDGNTGEWLAVNPNGSLFNINGNTGETGDFSSPTFGGPNPAIPEPSSAALGLLGLLAIFGRRRR